MQYDKKAFTLIELLVIISIVVLMTIALFSNYGKNNDSLALERGVHKLAQDLMLAREMAISGFEDSTDVNGCGVYIQPDASSHVTYILYKNKDEDKNYNSGTDEIISTASMEEGIIYISYSDPCSTPPSVFPLSIFFEPPDPITYIDGANNGYDAQLTFSIESDPETTRTLTINNAGKIQITNP